MSLAAAGYLPRKTVEEALALFAESALGPICTKDDIRDLDNVQERRLDTPRINYTFHKCDDINSRSSPHLDELVQMEQERLQSARAGFNSRSADERALLLAELAHKRASLN